MQSCNTANLADDGNKIMSKFEEIIPEYHRDVGSADSVDKMVQFLCTVGRLKALPRRGWTLPHREIPNPETISGHMYRMAIISMLLEDDADDQKQSNGPSDVVVNGHNGPSSEKLDISKVVQMSLVHDMAECIVGDITPYDGISEEMKHASELSAIKKLGKWSGLGSSLNLTD